MWMICRNFQRWDRVFINYPLFDKTVPLIYMSSCWSNGTNTSRDLCLHILAKGKKWVRWVAILWSTQEKTLRRQHSGAGSLLEIQCPLSGAPSPSSVDPKVNKSMWMSLDLKEGWSGGLTPGWGTGMVPMGTEEAVKGQGRWIIWGLWSSFSLWGKLCLH